MELIRMTQQPPSGVLLQSAAPQISNLICLGKKLHGESGTGSGFPAPGAEHFGFQAFLFCSGDGD